MKKLFAILLFSVALFTVVIAHPAYTANIENGAKVFAANCAMCHLGGGNVVMPPKTLKKAALEKYGMYSAEAIVVQVTKGKNAMPAFGRRLNELQIADVAAYVMAQAEKDWRK